MQPQNKITFAVSINWKGNVHTFHTTTSTELKAITNACHKLGKETHISGNRIFREIVDSTKVQVSRA